MKTTQHSMKPPDADSLSSVRSQLATMLIDAWLAKHNHSTSAHDVARNDSGKLAGDAARGRITLEAAMALVADAETSGVIAPAQANYQRRALADVAFAEADAIIARNAADGWPPIPERWRQYTRQRLTDGARHAKSLKLARGDATRDRDA